VTGAIVTVAVMGSAAIAAGGPNAAAAQTLFMEAKKLYDEGKYQPACAKFEKSNELDPAMGTKLNLARCWDKIDRTASAWAMYLEVADDAHAAGSTDREQYARTAAADLEPRLIKLVIEVATANPADLEVKRDDTVIGSGLYGTPIPIDPGAHLIVAKAPGRKPWSKKVTVAVKDAGTTTKVSVPVLSK
jgi:hypothetical protein